MIVLMHLDYVVKGGWPELNGVGERETKPMSDMIGENRTGSCKLLL